MHGHKNITLNERKKKLTIKEIVKSLTFSHVSVQLNLNYMCHRICHDISGVLFGICCPTIAIVLLIPNLPYLFYTPQTILHFPVTLDH